jgi:hypothetical protein
VRRILVFGGFLPPPTDQHGWRGRLSGVAFTVSILIPIGFLAYAAHIKIHTGLTPLTAVGLLVATAIVVAFAAYARR